MSFCRLALLILFGQEYGRIRLQVALIFCSFKILLCWFFIKLSYFSRDLFISLAEELSPIPSTSSEIKSPLYFQPSNPKDDAVPMIDDVDTKPMIVPAKIIPLESKEKDV